MTSHTREPIIPIRIYRAVRCLAAPPSRWPIVSRNTLAAPYTPAVPTSSQGTMRQTLTAGLKGRRATPPPAGTNAPHASGRLEGPPRDLAAQWHEQVISSQCHPTTYHHRFGIEDVHQIGNAGAEKPGRVGYDLEGQIVAIVGGLVHRLGRDLLQVAADVRCQPADRAGLDLLAGSERDVGSRGVGLEAAVVAALATPALGIDRRVADLAGAVG